MAPLTSGRGLNDSLSWIELAAGPFAEFQYNALPELASQSINKMWSSFSSLVHLRVTALQ